MAYVSNTRESSSETNRTKWDKTYQLFGHIHLASSFSKSLIRTTSKQKSSSSISLGSKDTIIDKDTSMILVWLAHP